MRPELAVEACAQKKTGKMFKIVNGECVVVGTTDVPRQKKLTASSGKAVDVPKKKRGGCSSCGGARVR